MNQMALMANLFVAFSDGLRRPRARGPTFERTNLIDGCFMLVKKKA